MKSLLHIRATMVVAVLVLSWGCDGSPKPQISEAQQALEDARQSGADEVAPDLLVQAEQLFQKAQDELVEQDNQFGLFRDYAEAKELLGQAKATALQAKTQGLTQESLQAEQERTESEQAKEEVIHAITAARMALKEVKALLMKAPEGKDTELVLEIMEHDIYSAETTLAEIPIEVTARDYAMVKEKAVEVETISSRIREQILQAIRKAEGSMP